MTILKICSESTKVSSPASLELLLDNTNCVFINKIYKKFGKEPIYDKNKNAILNIERFYNSKINISPFDFKSENGTYILQEKEFSINKVHYLINCSGIIAEMQKKISFLAPHYYLKNKNGKLFKTPKNQFNKNDYRIIGSREQNSVARVELVKKNFNNSKEEESFFKLEFLDEFSKNRIELLSFVVFLRKINSKYNGISDLTSFGRKFAKLRPFGPKKFTKK